LSNGLNTLEHTVEKLQSVICAPSLRQRKWQPTISFTRMESEHGSCLPCHCGVIGCWWHMKQMCCTYNYFFKEQIWNICAYNITIRPHSWSGKSPTLIVGRWAGPSDRNCVTISKHQSTMCYEGARLQSGTYIRQLYINILVCFNIPMFSLAWWDLDSESVAYN
jgi:hypothetical protein